MNKEILKIDDVVKSQLCIGCGICTIESNTRGMRYNKKNGCYTPIISNIDVNSVANKVCPGKGYRIAGLGKEIFPDSNNYDLDLGILDSFCAAKSTDDEILKNATSGGVMTSVLLYLLSKNLVDKVSVTKFICSQDGVFTVTKLTENKEEILQAQGSKYCPVNFQTLITELKEFEGRVAIVATPCVIAGIREIQREYPDYFRSSIVFMIANFCGGFKSLTNIDRLAKIHKVDIHSLTDFRFRGGGQPGSLRFVTKNGQIASTPYPKYVGLTGQSKMLRCHLCVDATGELADFACGDAWIPRFEEDEHPWSVVLCRSAHASKIIADMEKDCKINLSVMSKQEIKDSQRFNLKSKKNRQLSRLKLYKILGYSVPSFDGGYYKKRTSMKVELEVYIKHQIKSFSEKIGIYYFIYKKIKSKK